MGDPTEPAPVVLLRGALARRAIRPALTHASAATLDVRAEPAGRDRLVVRADLEAVGAATGIRPPGGVGDGQVRGRGLGADVDELDAGAAVEDLVQQEEVASGPNPVSSLIPFGV